MRVHPGKENKRQCHLIPSFPHHQFDAPNRGKIFLREFPKSRFIQMGTDSTVRARPDDSGHV